MRLEGLKVGDRVTMRCGGWGARIECFLVVKTVGKRKIVTDDGAEWGMAGWKWGGTPYIGHYIVPYEPRHEDERLEEEKQRRSRRIAISLRDHPWAQEPMETLEAVARLINMPTPEPRP